MEMNEIEEKKEDNPSNDLIISPDLFERSSVSKVQRKRSPLFRCKLRIFCSLHRPATLRSRLYHYLVTSLILFSCVAVNVFDEYFDRYAIIFMAVSDFILTGILTIELILRLWSSECISDFRGFVGKLRYLRKYGFMRGLDILGILTFVTFVFMQQFRGIPGTLLRLLHVTQVFQIYRLVLPLPKLMIRTIIVQFNQLYIAIITASIIFVLMSFSIYLKEMETITIFDGFWFAYITLTTIGYGDLSPNTFWGKILVVVLGFCGICCFQLPGNIFGTGLAIKLKDEEKKLMLQYPAANLIRTFWRCYATDRESKQKSLWKLYKKNRRITEMDKLCIRFILKYRYFRARHQFKTIRIDDDSELQLDLLRKVSLIENSLTELKDKAHELRYAFDSICDELEQLLNSLENN